MEERKLSTVYTYLPCGEHYDLNIKPSAASNAMSQILPPWNKGNKSKHKSRISLGGRINAGDDGDSKVTGWFFRVRCGHFHPGELVGE